MGVWTGHDADNLTGWTITFNRDGTFAASGSAGESGQGVYLVSGSSVSGIYTHNEVSGGKGSFTATVSNDTISLTWSNDTGTSGAFTAKKQ